MSTAPTAQDTVANLVASTSVITAIASKATELQPIISALSGIVALITGMFAIWFYIKKIKHLDGKAISQSDED